MITPSADLKAALELLREGISFNEILDVWPERTKKEAEELLEELFWLEEILES